MKRAVASLAIAGLVFAVAGCDKSGANTGPRPAPQSTVYATPEQMPTVIPTPTAPVILAQHRTGALRGGDIAHTMAPIPSPPVSASPKPKVPSSKPTTPKPATTKPKPQTTPPKPTTAAPTGNTLRIGSWSHAFVTAYGSQRAVDACNVVEWSPGWYVGHNYCGYQFWAYLGLGQTIVVTGKNAGTYRVTDLVYLPYQGGKAPKFTQKFDLVLQTCKGSGTQLVFAQKVG